MTNTNTTQPKAKPIFRKQLPGGISSAVFENHRDGRTYRSVNLQRSYRKDGKWNRMSMYLDHASRGYPVHDRSPPGHLEFLEWTFGLELECRRAGRGHGIRNHGRSSGLSHLSTAGPGSSGIGINRKEFL
jgi:hypothetical protein